MLPPSLQDSLPAGWLAFAGRASTLWIAAKGFRSSILLFWTWPGAREVSPRRFLEMPNDEPDLFSLDVRGFEDRPPLLDLGAVVGRERLRILILARRNFLAEIGEPLAHAGIG